VLSGEATNTNCIVFGLTRPGLEPTIHRIRGEHSNHYAIDAVVRVYTFLLKLNKKKKTVTVKNSTNIIKTNHDLSA
jgi:hypothetical protein